MWNSNYKTNLPDITASGEKPFKFNQDSSEVKLGQLDVKISALTEKIDQERKLKFWIIGTVIAVGAGIISGITFYHTVTKDYLESHRDLQDSYYKLLIENQKQVYDFKLCLATKKWLSPECLKN